jgi:hypothetical protein
MNPFSFILKDIKAKVIPWLKRSWIIILVSLGIVVFLVTRIFPSKKRRVIRRRRRTTRKAAVTRRRSSTSSKRTGRTTTKRKGRRIGNTFYPDTREGRAAWSRAMQRRRKK